MNKKQHSSSLCQHMSFRLKLYQQSTVLIAKAAGNEQQQVSFDYSGEEFGSLESYANYKREVGVHPLNVTFEDYKVVQDTIAVDKTDYMLSLCKLNASVLSQQYYKAQEYEKALRYLVNSSQKKLKSHDERSHASVRKMPKYITVKMVGEGGFGHVHLIMKQNESDRFTADVRSDLILKGSKNLYVLKRSNMPLEAKGELDIGDLAVAKKRAVNREKLYGECLFHPNIVESHGFYDSELFYLALYEYLPIQFEDLLWSMTEEVLERNNNPNFVFGEAERKKDALLEKRTLFYAAQFLLAIEYLHDLNIYHGDLKYDNILVDYRGYLKLIDFGLAIQAEDGESDLLFDCAITIGHTLKEFSTMENEYNEEIKEWDPGHAYEARRTDNCGQQDVFDARNNEFRIHEFDVSFFSTIFRLAYDDTLDPPFSDPYEFNYKDSGVAYFVLLFVGYFTTEDAIDPIEVPTAKAFRKHEYFQDIDFTKLLFKAYDLEKELDINLASLYYTSSIRETVAPSDSVFKDENKRMIYRTDSKKFLAKRYSPAAAGK